MIPYTFPTRVSGIPCQCNVLAYSPEIPMQITGPGFGDAIAPEPEDFVFQILDRKGYKAAWLERKLRPDDHSRLKREYLNEVMKVEYGLYELA